MSDYADFLTKRPISHAEARECAQKLINSHFRNGKPYARTCIPALPDSDDDLVLIAYIRQQEAKDAPRPPDELDRLMDAVKEITASCEPIDVKP